jgi:hypothetical protein
VGKEGVRTVSVTVLGETGFRGRKNWVKLAQRAVALAGSDLDRLAGLRLEVTGTAGWDPPPSVRTLNAVLETVMGTAGPRNGITLIIVGDAFYRKMAEPGVSLTFRGRPYTVLVAMRPFAERLGRDQEHYLAWLFRHALGHVFGVPDMDHPSIMVPDPERQTWEFDPESLSILRAARATDFASGAPFAGCDLEALNAAYLRLDDRNLLDVTDLVNLGAAFYRDRNPDPAAGLYERALRRDAGSPAARLGLAQTCLAQGDSAGARYLLETTPSGVLPPSELGVAGGLWASMGRPALAESLLTVAIAADSTRFVLWFKRGLSRFNEARFADARIDFERALAVENRPEAWFNLGLACDALGDRECAAASLDRYLELGPEGPARDRAAKLLERLARP